MQVSCRTPWWTSLVLLGCPAVGPAQQASAPGWGLALDWLQTQVDEYRDRLDRAQAILKRRAAGDAGLLARLQPAVPKARPHGYGLLPEIQPDRPATDVALHRNTFSIPDLTTRAAVLWRDGYLLVEQAAAAPDLGVLVGEFERLKGHLSWVQGQVSYHRYWQQAVLDHARFFELRNRLLPDADRLQALVTGGGDPAEIRRLRSLLEAKVAPFQKTRGLRLQAGADGGVVLPVTLVTDIDDAGFLRQFEAAVEVVFNRSAAARARGFRIALGIQRIPPARLFGGVAQARGSAVEERAHIARFAADALVLTTGAKSTHAFVGRYIQLGTSPTRPRELAHEFGHLLGFSDAYLRGYTGTPGGRLGCTLVEWGGLQDNLMGAPATGRVTAAMVERLLQAYRR